MVSDLFVYQLVLLGAGKKLCSCRAQHEHLSLPTPKPGLN